jgi:serine/threonine protein kinase
MIPASRMDQTLEAGTLIAGRYCIKRVIAAGGMGAVYDAIDERFGRPVAVKVVLKELAEDARLVARFEREAGAVARLSHPSIVHVHDFGAMDDGTRYLVMERIAGTNLADVLAKEGVLAPERAADLVEQALGALESAHEAGVVHRDLKPANLMVLPAGASRELVKVLDFGVAQLMSGEAYARLTKTGSIVGTPSFMSPEQARGESTDARTDLYAMGVVLYCLLTGKRPFDGGDLAQILQAVRSEPAVRVDVRRPGVPRALADIVERAMHKDPAQRYASARDMASALVAWRTSLRAGSAPPPSAVPTIIAPSTKRAAFAPTVPMTASQPPDLGASPLPRGPLPKSPQPPSSAPPASAALPTIASSAPSEAPPAAGWRARLPWLALVGLVGACALGIVGLVGAAILVPGHWLPERWTRDAPPTSAPPTAPLQPVELQRVELGGPSGACNLAYTCCDEYRRMIGQDAACEEVHDYDQQPRSLCDQVRMQYRSALDLQRYDTRMCDP